MKFLECDLEQIIMGTPNHALRERGLRINGRKKNQVRIGNYGIADIVTYHHQNGDPVRVEDGWVEHWEKVITVYELKKDKISLSTFAQGIQYIRGIQDYFRYTGRPIDDYYFELVLVGRKADRNSCLMYLPDLFYKPTLGTLSLQMFEYQYTIDGLSFSEIQGYYLSKKGFGS
jgi:hypothetical protein